jgi:hypothetical protein
MQTLLPHGEFPSSPGNKLKKFSIRQKERQPLRRTPFPSGEERKDRMKRQGRVVGRLKDSDAPEEASNEGVPLVITTAHRGVFFGYGQVTTDKIIRVTQARMCVYWGGGITVLGLASQGPGKECKIGPAVSAITIQDVTSIIEATPEAAKRWESQPWG